MQEGDVIGPKLTGDMPILGRSDIPPVPVDVIAPHEARAWANHGQTLGRLKQRCGLSVSEVVAILEDRPLPWKEIKTDVARLSVLVRQRGRAT